jgi:hypothetical protein
MFQFSYKLKVAERVKAKCERHPRYNPERDGRVGIKGGCSTCFSLYDFHQARLILDSAHREFLRKAIPWTRSTALRRKSQPNSTPAYQASARPSTREGLRLQSLDRSFAGYGERQGPVPSLLRNSPTITLWA